MSFDRIDTLILRRVPRNGQAWSHYPILDSQCIQALNLLVCSGCVERRARAQWRCNDQIVSGFALLNGDWRELPPKAGSVHFGLQTSEFQSTIIRLTTLGLAISADLFTNPNNRAQSHAIQFIRHMCIPGSIGLYLNESLTLRAEPHPFDINPHPIDVAIYSNAEI